MSHAYLASAGRVAFPLTISHSQQITSGRAKEIMLLWEQIYLDLLLLIQIQNVLGIGQNKYFK